MTGHSHILWGVLSPKRFPMFETATTITPREMFDVFRTLHAVFPDNTELLIKFEPHNHALMSIFSSQLHQLESSSLLTRSHGEGAVSE
ncbi:unnamed protein product [Sphenostylis stenocarpa]|uniref:Uncharacterized protein n=1 Tax=Sphenostylis stenocarpa TaxID=92480 RepID=A0AA86T683_9FABA|nr:unnamed protein product [Sphenostylis stenocarpa]